MDNFDRTVVAIWITSTVISLGALGVLIWGIIKLVNHFTQ